MRIFFLLLHLPLFNSFKITRRTAHVVRRSSNLCSMNVAQSGGKTILLVGPSFLQLNIAKLLHEKGHFPMIVAPQVQLDNFKKYLYNNTVPEDERPLCNDDQLTIGLPDLPLEPELLGGNNVIDGVIFTAEEALITPAALKAVLR